MEFHDVVLTTEGDIQFAIADEVTVKCDLLGRNNVEIRSQGNYSLDKLIGSGEQTRHTPGNFITPHVRKGGSTKEDSLRWCPGNYASLLVEAVHDMNFFAIWKLTKQFLTSRNGRDAWGGEISTYWPRITEDGKLFSQFFGHYVERSEQGGMQEIKEITMEEKEANTLGTVKCANCGTGINEANAYFDKVESELKAFCSEDCCEAVRQRVRI